jgi:carbon storage regulator
MLVLERRMGQKIVIGRGDGRIDIMVVSIVGNKVRLGIGAPREVPVHRWEVARAIDREGQK